MKVLQCIGLIACLAVIINSVPQRFQSRRGRQQAGGLGYSAPIQEEYGAPSEDAPSLYTAPAEEEPVVAPSEVDNFYLAPEASDVDTSYLAPEASDVDTSYLAPEASDVDTSYLAPTASADYPVEAPLESYAADEGLDAYSDLDAAGSELSDEAADPLKMLMNAVPGVPGEDYPIYAETPETAFACDGAVSGGYYADEEADCQVFHICAADAEEGLAKYSFLCPNGTIFNQNYFICDWWFNVDCSESAAIAEAKNSELAAAREEASASASAASAAADEAAAASEADAAYAAPGVEEGYLAPSEEYDYEDGSQAAYDDAQPSYEQRRRF